MENPRFPNKETVDFLMRDKVHKMFKVVKE